MPEEIIFNETKSDSENSIKKESEKDSKNHQEPPRFSPRRLIKIGFIIFIIITIIFSLFSVLFLRNPEQKKVEITYWGVKEDPLVIQKIIDDFTNEYPNISVNYSKQEIENYRDKVSTRIKNGNGPDVFKFHNTWLPMIKDDIAVLPIETMDIKKFSDNFYQVSQSDLIKDGQIYGVPTSIDTLALFINTDLYQGDNPKTWQEFIDISESITKRNEVGRIIIAGAGIGTYDNINHAPDILSLIFAQNAVNFEDPTESSIQISDAIKFYTTFALTENSVWDETLEPSRLAFTKGNLGMYFGYYWDYFDIKSQNPDLKFKIYEVPQILINEKANIASYWVDGVSATSINKKEAFLFLEYLARENTQKKLYESQLVARGLGQAPANKKLRGLSSSDGTAFSNQLETAVSSPFVDGTFDNGLNDALNEVLREVILTADRSSSTESLADDLITNYLNVISSFDPQPTPN